nr:hypothetical protein [Tanacetum cinerariifolium]
DINQGRGLQVSQDIEDSHVTLTLVHPDCQQESSSVSSFVTSMLNPISDVVQIQTDRLHDSYQRENDEFLKTIDDNMKKKIKEQPRKPLTPDHEWNKTLPAVQGSAQTWISELAKQADSCSSFNELLDTPMDFSNFIMNRLDVDTLTPKLLAGPTYELMRGSCNSLTELEYHLEEPLSLISNNRGRYVIPFAHFINNDLEYLRGGTSSQKYTTSMTKTKAADYGHIKWIEDLVPRTISTVSLLTENLLSMYTPRGGSLLSPISRLWNSTTISIWIGFRDGTLNDVHNALDDRLKGIRMQYLPQSIWRKGDKDRAAAMIQAIDKMLKTRRIMRSFERFVGGRLYEGDFQMLQRPYDSSYAAPIFTEWRNAQPSPATQSQKDFVSKLTEIHSFSIDFLTSS